MKGVFHALKYIGPYRRYVLLNIISNIFFAFFSASVLLLAAPFLDLLFKYSMEEVGQIVSAPPPSLALSNESIQAQIRYILAGWIWSGGKPLALIYMCFCVWILTFLKNFFRYMAMYFLAPIRNGVVHDLRNKLYDHAIRMEVRVLSNERKGDILSRISNDVSEIEWSIMQTLEMIFREPIVLLLILTMMCVISFKITVYMLALLPLALVSIRLISIFLKSRARLARKRLADLMNRMEETLHNVKIIKAFNREEFFSQKFREENRRFRDTSVQVYRLTDLASPLNEVIVVSILMLILYIGGIMVFKDELSSSLFITYFGLASQLIPPVKQLSIAYSNIQKGKAAEQRIEEILNLPQENLTAQGKVRVSGLVREIRLEDVVFTHSGRTQPALNGISMVIPAGKMVALAGASGSGKTTLSECLMKFNIPSQGKIFWDGTDLNDIETASLRKCIGWVSQEILLFHDTVYNNVTFGNNSFSPSEVEKACRMAHAHEFIQELPEKYQTIIGDRGNFLSGGQKQRLSLARALLLNPSLLILDEATSSLDSESEQCIHRSLEELRGKMTILIIAHRMNTLKKADIIYMMHQGKIENQGTHELLLASSSRYNEWIKSQVFE